MGFSTGLYYPWIDIRDAGWLKNAALYWETIRTIVPESIYAPYSTDTARALASEDVLIPLRVHSDMEEIEALNGDVVRFLDSSECGEVLVSGEYGPPAYVHLEKLPRALRRLARIHPGKLSHEIRHILNEIGRSRRNPGEWLEVDSAFANFYMTLLATRLAERTGAGLLTPAPASHKLSLAARTDATLAGLVRRLNRSEREFDACGPRRRMPSTLAQGMLVDLIVEDLGIDPDTPVEKILEFRRKHSAELGRFRQEISKLTSGIDQDKPAEGLRQAVADIYKNRAQPALDELKKAMRGSKIKWLTGTVAKVTFLSAGSSSALVGLGLAVPQALLVGAGLTMTASTILYSVEKRESLTHNPFSYVLSAARAFR